MRMGKDAFEITVNVVKMFVLFVGMVSVVPFLVWVERRGSAFIQNRLGPNRVGPMGLMQLAADAVKFFFKEEFLPAKGVKFMYYGAPVAALIPGALAFASIPLSIPIALSPFEFFGRTLGPYTFLVQGYDLGIGIVFVLGISSLGTYSILMAGWGSGNKFALLGALRASAQAISYELALSLSLVGILMIFGSFHFTDIVRSQIGTPLTYSILGHSMSLPLPAWGVFYQPLGALIFFAATFAEANRLPFDLAEAEAELVAGFHTEYGGLKMNLFF
ncbi:MAG: NADH-quinone oxidoreductase subunit H, partial [Proteobacteria bacterium]